MNERDRILLKATEVYESSYISEICELLQSHKWVAVEGVRRDGKFVICLVKIS